MTKKFTKYFVTHCVLAKTYPIKQIAHQLQSFRRRSGLVDDAAVT